LTKVGAGTRTVTCQLVGTGTVKNSYDPATLGGRTNTTFSENFKININVWKRTGILVTQIKKNWLDLASAITNTVN
jgi:hypothetical protein